LAKLIIKSVSKSKTNKKIKVPTKNDEVQIILQKIQALKLNDVPEKSVQELKKRKLISEMFV
jgi:hypothetical protein